MFDDPIVKEIRKIREQIASECNYDVHTYFEMLRKEEAQFQKEIPNSDRSPKIDLKNSKFMRP